MSAQPSTQIDPTPREKHLRLMDAILNDKTKTDDPILASFQAWTLMFDEALERIK